MIRELWHVPTANVEGIVLVDLNFSREAANNLPVGCSNKLP